MTSGAQQHDVSASISAARPGICPNLSFLVSLIASSCLFLLTPRDRLQEEVVGHESCGSAALGPGPDVCLPAHHPFLMSILKSSHVLVTDLQPRGPALATEGLVPARFPLCFADLSTRPNALLVVLACL